MQKAVRFTLAILLSLLLVLCLSGFTRSTDNSGNVVIGSTETINDDAFLAGNSVVNQGTVKSDLYMAGSNVFSSGKVLGDILAVGNSLTVTGSVDGNLRLAGNTISVIGSTGKNVTIGGNNLLIGPAANIGGNLLAGGNNLQLQGRVGGNLNAGGSTVEITGTVGGNATISAQHLAFGPGAKITGNLTYYSDRDISIPPGVVQGQVNRVAPPMQPKTAGQKAGFPWQSRLIGTIGLLLIALLIGLLFPQRLAAANSHLRQKPLNALGLGLAAVLATPVLTIILCITLVGLPLGLIMLLLYIIGMYLARIVVGYWLGSLIFRHNPRPILPLLAGTLIAVILSWLPFVGWLIYLTATVLGLGAFWMQAVYRQRELPEQADI